MTRLAAFAAALVLAGPAVAGTYSAVPQGSVKPTKVVTRDLAWTLKGNAFVGRTEESRPLVLCQALAKKVGPLASFTVDGRALGAADLAKCNGFVAGAGQPVANAN